MSNDYKPAYLIEMDMEYLEFCNMLHDLSQLDCWDDDFFHEDIDSHYSEFDLNGGMWSTSYKDSMMGTKPMCFANTDVRDADPKDLLKILEDHGFGDKVRWHGTDVFI